MRFLIIFIFFVTTTLANSETNIKNLVINKELKKINNLTFLDAQSNKVSLDNYRGKLILINFWATWCAPCKDEMPSLDALKMNSSLSNLKIFPINVGKENVKKSKKFFEDLNIKNLDIYFDNNSTLAKNFSAFSILSCPTFIGNICKLFNFLLF